MAIWFECKGCGKPAAYHDETEGPNGKGTVAHSKPAEKLGVPDSTGCDLFRRSTAQHYWRIHQNAKRIGIPKTVDWHCTACNHMNPFPLSSCQKCGLDPNAIDTNELINEVAHELYGGLIQLCRATKLQPIDALGVTLMMLGKLAVHHAQRDPEKAWETFTSPKAKNVFMSTYRAHLKATEEIGCLISDKKK